MLKNLNKKKIKKIKNLQSLIPKDLNFNKIKIKPIRVLENTKSKISNFYSDYKKQKEKEKIRLEKKKKLMKKENF